MTIKAILDTNVLISGIFWKGAPFERKFSFADKELLHFAQAEIEEVRAGTNADFAERMGDRERSDGAASGSNGALLRRNGEILTTFISTLNIAKKNARSTDCRRESALFHILQ